MRFRSAVLVLAILAFGFLLTRLSLPAPPPAALGAFGRGPTVVLVHGLGSNAEHWLPVARDLARDHRVVFVELPGHGIAAMPRLLTVENAALALDRAIREQGDEPVLLVGHSIGGLIAAAEALHAPNRVRGLVLVETALRPQLAAADRTRLLAALERDYPGTLRENYAAFGRDSAQGARLFAEAARMDPAMLKSWIRLAVTADLSEAAPKLRVPLLVVLADRSWPEGESWAACADTLGYRGVHDAQPVRIAGSGHFVMIDQPQRLAEAIRRFGRGAGAANLAAR